MYYLQFIIRSDKIWCGKVYLKSDGSPISAFDSFTFFFFSFLPPFFFPVDALVFCEGEALLWLISFWLSTKLNIVFKNWSMHHFVHTKPSLKILILLVFYITFSMWNPYYSTFYMWKRLPIWKIGNNSIEVKYKTIEKQTLTFYRTYAACSNLKMQIQIPEKHRYSEHKYQCCYNNR